ncbi:permease [Salibacterium salarium]|uniref:Permease n=1 Tax=Salibacterium salarium TaxID=284579 RepID=A0A3R9WMH6_9BACI|nr:permease [Salibacterium salarium]RSL29541.1 permease [Salibacterium salarium]
MPIFQFLQTFFILFIELTVLFIFISFLVSWLQQKVTEDRIKRILNRPNKWSGYLYGTGLGALTPFCSCSTIPILAGLLSSKAPFGPSMSFLIASPLLNPVVVILLWTLLGGKLTLYYVIVVAIFSIFIGVLWERLGLQRLVKDVRVRKGNSTNNDYSVPKWKLALQDAWSFFYPLLPFLLIGVFIGAIIYDFVPQDLIAKYAGSDKPWTIPIASVIGIPMYIRAEAILPIGDALISKGMGIGSVIALLVGGAGASIPEVVLLNKLFKRKLVAAFVASILFVAVSTGFIVQIIL